MAIKGFSYIKTLWTFEERPVSSAKLNQWDDRIEGALETAFFLLNQAWGGGSGVLRGIDAGELEVRPTEIEGMSVQIDPGYAFIDAFPFRLSESATTAALIAPTVHDRIDLVQADLTTWSISVKTGDEAELPVAPVVDNGALALAHIRARPTMAFIRDVDDGVNAFLEDVRVFL